MVASFISLAGIFLGIIGSCLARFIIKNNRFSITSRAIIGAFSSVFIGKFVGRIGFGPKEIIGVKEIDYFLLFIYISLSLISGVLGVLLFNWITKYLSKKQ